MDLDFNTVLKPCSQAGRKGPRCEAREKFTRDGVLKQYLGATPLRAKMIFPPTERTQPKHLPRTGWWQMGLFQRAVRFLTTFDFQCYPSVDYSTRDPTRSHVNSMEDIPWQFDSSFQ